MRKHLRPSTRVSLNMQLTGGRCADPITPVWTDNCSSMRGVVERNAQWQSESAVIEPVRQCQKASATAAMPQIYATIAVRRVASTGVAMDI